MPPDAFTRAVEGLKPESLLDQLVEAWEATIPEREFSEIAGEIAEQWRQARFDNAKQIGKLNTETGEPYGYFRVAVDKDTPAAGRLREEADRQYPTGEEG